MKKIFTLFAFALIGFTANAQTSILDNANKTNGSFYQSYRRLGDKVTDTVLHRVSWVDQIGTKEEISTEIKVRKALILGYKKDGYVFDKLERTPKGLFMRFVKNT